VRDREDLPEADGPLVEVELPDKQRLLAVVRSRLQERDGSWWYLVEIPVYVKADVHGRFVGEPSPVTFTAPAAACTPIEGEDYSDVPIERLGRTPAWYIEQRMDANAPARQVVHRGDCHAGHGRRQPADAHEAFTALVQDDAVACAVCHPDRVLRSHR
jgi:hypothetical protein